MNFILETVNNSLQLMSKNFNETTVDQNCWCYNLKKNTCKQNDDHLKLILEMSINKGIKREK